MWPRDDIIVCDLLILIASNAFKTNMQIPNDPITARPAFLNFQTSNVRGPLIRAPSGIELSHLLRRDHAEQAQGRHPDIAALPVRGVQ